MEKSTLERLNPEISAMSDTWKRVRIFVEEEEKSYTDASIFLKLPNEEPDAKANREQPFKTGFVNPAQQLISLKGDYVFGKKIQRTIPSEVLKQFVNRADLSGDSLEDFMKSQASPNLQAYGTVFAVVDKPRGMFENAEQEQSGGMPYLCILDPQQVRDWQWAKDGSLDWFRYAIKDDDVRDYNAKPGASLVKYVTWTKTDYYLHDDKGNEIETFAHGFGVVPVAVQASFVLNSRKTLGRSTFFTTTRHLIMGNNHLSVANVEIFRYSSVLLMDQRDWDTLQRSRVKNPDTNLPKLQDKADEGNVLAVSELDKGAPRYLEKSVEAIVKANAQAQWYFNMASQAEAVGQEALPMTSANESGGSVPGNTAESGIAKAYDFQDMNATLKSHASYLESFEKQILTIVKKIMKVSEDFQVKYPSEFDVRSLERKIQFITSLKAIQFPSEKGMELAYQSITPELSGDEGIQAEINKQIEEGVDFSTPPKEEPKAETV